MARMLRMSGLTTRRGIAMAAAVAIPLALAPAASAHDSHHNAAADVRAGYYTQWSVYSGFTPKSVVDNGDASHLNEIQYAFINVAPNTAVAGSPIECSNSDNLTADKLEIHGGLIPALVAEAHMLH